MLELLGAYRNFLDGYVVNALQPTDLRVESGAYIAITGPSGSGKSTLLNMLGLLDRPSGGSYLVGGIEMSKAGEAARASVRGQMFGFVFQAFHLLPGRTAAENVELGMLYGPHARSMRRKLAAEALDRVGLGDRRHSDPRHMSGGERQRVAIARAIAPMPQVLFCDEPTGNLDSITAANIIERLGELTREGISVVVATHDSAVAGHANRRLQVMDGTVSETTGV